MGHEERFLPSKLSAGFLLRKETIAGRRRNGRGAPIAEQPTLAPKRGFDPKAVLRGEGDER